MVEERVTDPTRIAQLLASEVTGLSLGSLEECTVVDADDSVEPGPDQPVAYRIEYRGESVATVELAAEFVVLTLESAGDRGPIDDGVSDRDDIEVTSGEGSVVVHVRTGAAVKPAVDVLRRALGESDRA